MSAEADLPEHYLDMPAVKAGMTVGLFGGSFNPPHEGHLLIAQHAMEALKLDQLWWMVSPGNPLKDHSELPTLAERIRLSEALIDDPRIKVTGFEAARKIRYSAETIELVLGKLPDVRFVWVMGADSLASFDKWARWQWIVETIPIAVYNRPGSSLADHSSVMAQTFAAAKIDEARASELAQMQPPAWTFIHGPLSPLSSTELRNGKRGNT